MDVDHRIGGGGRGGVGAGPVAVKLTGLLHLRVTALLGWPISGELWRVMTDRGEGLLQTHWFPRTRELELTNTTGLWIMGNDGRWLIERMVQRLGAAGVLAPIANERVRPLLRRWGYQNTADPRIMRLTVTHGRQQQ